MDRDSAPAKTRRQQRDLHFPALCAVRLSSALGALRKLGVAPRNHSHCPDVSVQLDLRCLAAFDGKQHLHPDRFCRAGRARLQERHPDRRVRQTNPGSRSQRSFHRRSRSLPPAIASDSDDFICFHFWCSPSGSQHRCRRGNAPGARHRCLLRNARSNRLRPISHARLLRRDHVVQRAPRQNFRTRTNTIRATFNGGTGPLN